MPQPFPVVHKCRHVNYVPGVTTNPIPIVREMAEQGCLDEGLTLDVYGLRLFDYTPDAIPILATALKCCDEVNQCPKVETDCFVSGISPSLKFHVRDVANCASANRQIVRMEYCKDPGFVVEQAGCIDIPACGSPVDPPSGCDTCDVEGKGKWTGSLVLQGGTLDLEVCCFLNETDELTFRLIWRGCDEGCITVQPQCIDPLFVNFGNISALQNCCDCANTIDITEINLEFVANCHPVVSGRHCSYTPEGIPVVATENTCFGSGQSVTTCTPTCDLVATIVDVTDPEGDDGGCDCLEDVVALPYVGSQTWETFSAGSCAQEPHVTLLCVANLDEDDNPDGTVTLTLTIVCGTTNTGTASLTIAAVDLETLDVTFTIEMTDPSFTGPCGTCRYVWNAMPMSWSFVSNSCTGDCECVAPTTPGTIDGEQIDTNCSSGGGLACCIGTVTVRVMR